VARNPGGKHRKPELPGKLRCSVGAHSPPSARPLDRSAPCGRGRPNTGKPALRGLIRATIVRTGTRASCPLPEASSSRGCLTIELSFKTSISRETEMAAPVSFSVWFGGAHAAALSDKSTAFRSAGLHCPKHGRTARITTCGRSGYAPLALCCGFPRFHA
jgi:hypothetical protein